MNLIATHVAHCEHDGCGWKRHARVETMSMMRALHIAGHAHMKENVDHLVSVDRLEPVSANKGKSA